MHSPPHRQILLDAQFTGVGIGVADGTPVDTPLPGATFAADFGS